MPTYQSPKTRGRIFTLLLLGFVLVGLVFSVISPFSGSAIGKFSWPQFSMPTLPSVSFPSFAANLDGYSRGRTNILILGSDYGVSTDTIIVLSIDYKTKSLNTLTIPRDLQITQDNQTKKINSFLQSAIGRGQTPSEASLTTAQTISDLIDQPIDYYLKIDIGGFTKVIDTLGGVEIDVENSFGDCQFPTPNFDGYLSPCPEFTKGRTTMDSRTALIFARSRKSYNNPLEAIDFARSRRQSKVIEAVLTKIKANPLLIPQILSNVSDNLITNIPITGLPNLFSQYSGDGFTPKITNRTVDYESGIICPDTNSSDIILCNGNQSLELLHRLAATGSLSGAATQLTTDQKNQKITIISNGSSEALNLINQLKSIGFDSSNLIIDNSYQGIKLATSSSTETIKIYTINPEILKLLTNQVANNSNWRVINETQTKYKLSGDYQGSEVVVVVE